MIAVLHPPRFVPPPTAISRTWLLEAFGEQSLCERFWRLLNQVEPGRAACVSRRDPNRIASALLNSVDKLFPIYEPMTDRLEDLQGFGIPVAPLGYSHEYNASGAVDLAALLSLHAGPYDYETVTLSDFPTLSQTEWARRNRPAPIVPFKNPKPPRGRIWLEPWGGLADLVRYVNHDTGYNWLDFSDDDEFISPPWNMDEINALSAGWRKAGPIYKRVVALANYIDADPEHRLPLLDGALRGDRNTLLQLTQPKPQPLVKAFERGRSGL